MLSGMIFFNWLQAKLGWNAKSMLSLVPDEIKTDDPFLRFRLIN